jgi:hypothetical protein
MQTQTLHPETRVPLQAVPRAEQPLSRVHDLALIELEGPIWQVPSSSSRVLA